LAPALRRGKRDKAKLRLKAQTIVQMGRNITVIGHRAIKNAGATKEIFPA